jgi:DNA-binding response OmpR family regulator
MEKFDHVLVVDDDGAVRDVLHHILDELGYRVSLAKHGDAARAVLDLLDVDLLIADERLRGEHGRALAAYARSLGVPTLLMSADNEVQRRFAGADEPFIGKPFRFESFREQVKRVLAMPRGDPDGC